jgi:hypothetical protein
MSAILPTSPAADPPALRAMALATDEQALSRPLESTAVTAAKYRAPAKSPVTPYVMVSLICGLVVGDGT